MHKRKCCAARCRRLCCVESGDDKHKQQFCLLHLYSGPFASGGDIHLSPGQSRSWRLIDPAEYAKQKVEATEKVKDLAHEVAEDVQAELDRLASKKAKKKRQDDRNVSKMVMINNPFAQGGAAVKDKREDDGGDELYVKQMKHLQNRALGKGRKSEGLEKKDEKKGKRLKEAEKVKAPGEDYIAAKVFGDELNGLSGVPAETWRKGFAEKLASTLVFGSLDPKVKGKAGKVALALERALYARVWNESTSSAQVQSVDVAPAKASSSTLDLTGDFEDDENPDYAGPTHDSGLIDQLRKQGAKSTIDPAQAKRAAYNTHARSLLRNLRHKENVDLRAKILAGSLEPVDVIHAPPGALMNPTAALQWENMKSSMLRQLTVVDVEEALSQRTEVDNLICPRCGNKSKNIVFSMGSHHESSKADIWGNKEGRSEEKERYQCSECRFHWKDR